MVQPSPQGPATAAFCARLRLESSLRVPCTTPVLHGAIVSVAHSTSYTLLKPVLGITDVLLYGLYYFSAFAKTQRLM